VAYIKFYLFAGKLGNNEEKAVVLGANGIGYGDGGAIKGSYAAI